MMNYEKLTIFCLFLFVNKILSYDITICNDNSYKFNPIELSCTDSQSRINISEAYAAFVLKTSTSKECDADIAGKAFITNIFIPHCNTKSKCLITNEFITQNKLFQVEKYATIIKQDYFEIPLKLYIIYNCDKAAEVLSTSMMTTVTTTLSTTINFTISTISSTPSITTLTTKNSSTILTTNTTKPFKLSITQKTYLTPKNKTFLSMSTSLFTNASTLTTTTKTSTRQSTTKPTRLPAYSTILTMNQTKLLAFISLPNYKFSKEILNTTKKYLMNSTLATSTVNINETKQFDNLSTKSSQNKIETNSTPVNKQLKQNSTDAEKIKIDASLALDEEPQNDSHLDKTVLAILISLGAAILLTIISIVLFLYYKYRRTSQYRKELNSTRNSPQNSRIYDQSTMTAKSINDTISSKQFTDLTVTPNSRPKSKVVYHVETINYGNNPNLENDLYSTIKPRILTNENLAIPIQVNYDEFWKTKI